MAYFNMFSLFKYVFNSIKYRIFKHFKLFTILFLVFIIAFLFGTQSKAVELPDFDSIIQDEYYFVYYDNWYGYCVVTCPQQFYLRLYTLNGNNYITAYNPQAFNMSNGYWDKNTGAFTWWERSNSQYLYLRKSDTFEVENFYKFSNFDIYNFPGTPLVFAKNPYTPLVTPYFITTQNELNSFDFDYLQISGGTTPYQNEIPEGVFNTATFNLKYKYKGVTNTINILDEYINFNSSNNTWQINIPYNVLTNNVVIRNGENYEYQFTYSLYGYNTYSISKTGTYNLTSEQEDTINQDNDKQLKDSIYQQQQDINNGINDLKDQQQIMTNSIDNMNNSLTDSNVDNTSVNDIADLSNGFSVTDNTGIDQLFQMVYNAFCTNQAEDIVFTIPFTNNQVTINQNNISNNFPEAIKNIVGVFVWGFIGLYVLKDIRSIINKISEGSPEDVGSDVKKEVL